MLNKCIFNYFYYLPFLSGIYADTAYYIKDNMNILSPLMFYIHGRGLMYIIYFLQFTTIISLSFVENAFDLCSSLGCQL